jgi:prophage antirepressor-like protein
MSEIENQIVVYQPNETVRLDVRLENETVWLTQEQIANLFGTKRPAITKHLANIYKSGELEREGTCSILEHMGNDGKQSYKTMFYNLDAILSVGYRVNSRNATFFRRWATQVLKTYLLKGYAVNSRLNQLEDKVDRRLAKHESDIIELKNKVDFFVQTKELPLQSVFYQGKFWDAKSLLIKFIRRAKKELIVVDAYPGVATLDMLAKRGRGVSVELVTHSNGELAESDYEAFAAQCGKFTKTICGICHDRFIIVDQREIYLIGASLKDAGRLTFAVAKMGGEVISGFLESIRKAASKRKEYGKKTAKPKVDYGYGRDV